jgi:hypothetical membrane protein
MRASKTIKLFSDRFPLIGPTVWILSIQYFIIQVVTAQAWSMPYSLRLNPISDLGNTACAMYGSRFVCSPLHNLMNASFILLGLTMATGSLFIYQEFKDKRATLVGFSFMAVAGFGTLLVGLFPENGVGLLHLFGAGLTFLIGNLGLVVLSFAMDIPKSLRVYTFLSGSIALLALLLFVIHYYPGIGIGGMERLTAYPQTIWLIVFGLYIKRMRQHNLLKQV